MDKYSMDYLHLEREMSRPKYYKYSDVKDNLVKVAFDIVRFRDSDNIDGLWKIEETKDGEVIVAMYDDISSDMEVRSNWEAVADKRGENVNVFYKGEPVTKFAAKEHGIDDIEVLVKSLPETLENNKNLRMAMLGELSFEDRSLLCQKYPELNDK